MKLSSVARAAHIYIWKEEKLQEVHAKWKSLMKVSKAFGEYVSSISLENSLGIDIMSPSSG